MTEENKKGSKKCASTKTFFRKISKGDLVTIHGEAGERKGHATSRDHGNWVLVLERNMGTALATKENIVGLQKPRTMVQSPKVGQRLVYDDGRRSVGTVVEVGSHSMHVLFDNRIESNLIHFDDSQWMDYITFDD